MCKGPLTAALLSPGENADAEDLSAHVTVDLKSRGERPARDHQRRRTTATLELRADASDFPRNAGCWRQRAVLAPRHDGYPNLPQAWRRQVNQGDLAARRPARSVPIRMVETSPIWTPISGPFVGKSDRDHAARRKPDACRQRRRSDGPASPDGAALMIAPPPGVRVWLAAAITDIAAVFGGRAALCSSRSARIRSVADCLASAAAVAT
jgi:hypothetical protein